MIELCILLQVFGVHTFHSTRSSYRHEDGCLYLTIVVMVRARLLVGMFELNLLRTKVPTAGISLHMYTAELIFEHFPELTPNRRSNSSALGPLWEWNAKITVISRKDMSPLPKARLTV